VDVAKSMGWSQSRVTKYEIGVRRLTLRDGIALANLFGVTLNELDPATDPKDKGLDTG
jgi:transcriptional regulator with XRE-family HTH domain